MQKRGDLDDLILSNFGGVCEGIYGWGKIMRNDRLPDGTIPKTFFVILKAGDLWTFNENLELNTFFPWWSCRFCAKVLNHHFFDHQGQTNLFDSTILLYVLEAPSSRFHYYFWNCQIPSGS